MYGLSIPSSFSSPLGIMLIVVSVLIALGILLLLVAVVRMNTRLRYLTYPVYDKIVKEAQRKATDILNNVYEKKRDIIAAAEEAATRLLADKENEFEKFHAEYAERFSALEKKGADAFNTQTTIVSHLSEQLTEVVKKHLAIADETLKKEDTRFDEITTHASKQLEHSFANLAATAEKEYQKHSAEIQTRVADGIEKEISEAKKAIAVYRQERIALVDRNSVSLVTETARAVLGKALSFEEHRDLILRALEDAKKAGVFTT